MNESFRINSGNDALRRRLFVAAGAVDLPRAEKPVDDFRFEGGFELRGRGVIVFDGVGGADDFGAFEPRNGADYFFLRLLFFLLLRRFLRSSSKRVMLSSPTAETKSGADASGSLLRESGLTPLRFILIISRTWDASRAYKFAIEDWS